MSSEEEVMEGGAGAERGRGPTAVAEDGHVVVHVDSHFATSSEADRGAIGHRDLAITAIGANVPPAAEPETDRTMPRTPQHVGVGAGAPNRSLSGDRQHLRDHLGQRRTTLAHL